LPSAYVASGAKVCLWDMNADLLATAKAELGRRGVYRRGQHHQL